jgi:hypothetical protein
MAHELKGMSVLWRQLKIWLGILTDLVASTWRDIDEDGSGEWWFLNIYIYILLLFGFWGKSLTGDSEDDCGEADGM